MINAPKFAFLIIWFVIVAGCGGTGSSSPTTVSGVAAVGSPLTGTAFLKDSSNPPRELSISLAEGGSFSFDTRGLTPPFLLKAVGTAGSTPATTLYSCTPAAGIANINPLSHLAVAEAYGTTELAALYATPDAAAMRLVATGLHDAVGTVLTVLRPTLVKLGIPENNFIFDQFVANHQGFDLLLDMISVTIDNGIVTIVDKAAGTTMEMPLSDFRNRSVDAVPLASTTPGSVNIWPATPTVTIRNTQQFLSLVMNSTTQQVVWSVDEAGGGTITSSGLYTAPETTGIYHVRATSSADDTRSAVATVTVTGTNVIRLAKSGEGIYVLTGENLVNVGGIRAKIVYDTFVLGNPVVVKGSLGPNSMAVSNTNVPGNVILAYLSPNSFSGTTTLATITFAVLGPGTADVVLSDLECIGLGSNSSIAAVDVTVVAAPPSDSSDGSASMPAPEASITNVLLEAMREP